MAGDDDGIRIADVFSYASTIAQSLAAPEVTLAHVRDAVAVLAGERTMEDLLDVRRVPFQRANPNLAADAEARELAQAWFERLGGSVAGTFDAQDLAAFREDIARRLGGDEG